MEKSTSEKDETLDIERLLKHPELYKSKPDEIIAKWIDERRVSEITSIPLQSLRNMRHLGRGFQYSKIGRSVRYNIFDIIRHMERHKIKTDDFK